MIALEVELLKFFGQLVLDDFQGALVHLLDHEEGIKIDLVNNLFHAGLEIALEILLKSCALKRFDRIRNKGLHAIHSHCLIILLN